MELSEHYPEAFYKRSLFLESDSKNEIYNNSGIEHFERLGSVVKRERWLYNFTLENDDYDWEQDFVLDYTFVRDFLERLDSIIK